MVSNMSHRIFEVLREGGPVNLLRAIYNYSTPRYVGKYISSRGRYGENVLTKEWDVLILLDTCRVDALHTVSDEYEFINNINNIASIGGTSAEWIANTFTKNHIDTIENTIYLANNVFASEVFDNPEETLPDIPLCDWNTVKATDFKKLEQIWKYEPKGEGGKIGHIQGHTPPRPVTDRAIKVMREHDSQRVILHYNQPHKPYTANALKEDRELELYESNPFDYLRRGGDIEKVYSSYLDNLRYALDDVELLLENIDAERVVISADHGEAFGEWCTYEHPFGSLNPVVRRVPWMITSAEDKRTYSPQLEPIDDSKRDIDELLNALGYH